MMNKKSLKIGKYTLIQIDWFEITKFLSVLGGLNIAGLILGVYLIKEDYKTLISLVFALLNFGLFLIISKTVNIIRDMHPDKELEVKINGDN